MFFIFCWPLGSLNVFSLSKREKMLFIVKSFLFYFTILMTSPIIRHVRHPHHQQSQLFNIQIKSIHMLAHTWSYESMTLLADGGGAERDILWLNQQNFADDTNATSFIFIITLSHKSRTSPHPSKLFRWIAVE